MAVVSRCAAIGGVWGSHAQMRIDGHPHGSFRLYREGINAPGNCTPTADALEDGPGLSHNGEQSNHIEQPPGGDGHSGGMCHPPGSRREDGPSEPCQRPSATLSGRGPLLVWHVSAHIADCHARRPPSAHEEQNGEPGPSNGEHRPLNGEHRPLNGEPRPLNGEHRPLNGEPRPLNGEPRPLNGEHGP